MGILEKENPRKRFPGRYMKKEFRGLPGLVDFLRAVEAACLNDRHKQADLDSVCSRCPSTGSKGRQVREMS